MFELTGEYSIILPLMLAIVLATGISHLVSHDTVYTRKLLRRGIDIDEPADAALARRRLDTVMTVLPTPSATTRSSATWPPSSPGQGQARSRFSARMTDTSAS
jgi:hypothetical protein